MSEPSKNPSDRVFAMMGSDGKTRWVNIDEEAKKADRDRRKLEMFASLADSLETLIEYVADKCDENMNPAWCCNHQKKRCTGEADVCAARILLARAKELS